MAIITSHFLNGVDGTHAAGVAASLIRISADGTRTVLQEAHSDDGGRVRLEMDAASHADTDQPGDAQYELVIASGAYFTNHMPPPAGMTIKRDIVMRFDMPDPAAHYHMPVIMSPNSYSTWWSS